ncbi:hypothetical protein LJC09_00530 [Desulfovibrio sp. OttesenSCG-928-F20]|nr:hypothetical protein [Desulfovibrio sp. OttesenSCG-928-M16]MDL2290577.1 hypothetical protein [Desulfovibrio sp. OttesenSCG-928-F20]
MYANPLNSRLRNCLVTILELEEDLEQTELGPVLQSEFSVLKEVVRRLDAVCVEEQDVCRIEAATSRFLAELKETLDSAALAPGASDKILQ